MLKSYTKMSLTLQTGLCGSRLCCWRFESRSITIGNEFRGDNVRRRAIQSVVVLHQYIPSEAGAAYPDFGRIFCTVQSASDAHPHRHSCSGVWDAFI